MHSHETFFIFDSLEHDLLVLFSLFRHDLEDAHALWPGSPRTSVMQMQMFSILENASRCLPKSILVSRKCTNRKKTPTWLSLVMQQEHSGRRKLEKSWGKMAAMLVIEEMLHTPKGPQAPRTRNCVLDLFNGESC